ncbi:MAG: sodium:solute symporter family protein [Lachnospiraceae bacterium]
MRELVSKPELLIFVGIYFVALIIVGIVSSKKANQSSEEFVLAGRSLGPIVLMGTFLATFTGNGTISGGGNSLAFTYGIWPGVLFGLPAICGILVLFALSKKIRANGSYTVAELLEKKYGSAARIVSGLIIALSMVSICSYQYKGMAFVLSVTTGMDENIATVVSAVLIIFLAFSGGLKSVAISDAMSAFLMFGGILIATPFVISAAGGWSVVCANASETSLTLTGGMTPLQFLASYFPLFFLCMGDQNMYQRMAAGKDNRAVKIGMVGWLVGVIVVIPLVAVIAFCAKSMFGDNIQAGMAFMSSTTVIPTAIGGILLAAATAFIITTGDSYLLSGATNVTYDLYANVINPNATDKQKHRVTKLCILGLGIAGYIILQFFPSVLAIQYWSYTIYGAGITPALLGALVWKKVTKAGGIASMVVGTIITIVWEATGLSATVSTVIIAVPAAFIVLIIVTLCTQPKKAVKK